MDSTVPLGTGGISVQEPHSSAPITILLQKAKLWNETYLRVARIKVIEDVTIEDLLGPEYVPVDGDRGNTRLTDIYFVVPAPVHFSTFAARALRTFPAPTGNPFAAYKPRQR